MEVLSARFEGVKPAFRDGKTAALTGFIRERIRAPILRLLVPALFDPIRSRIADGCRVGSAYKRIHQ